MYGFTSLGSWVAAQGGSSVGCSSSRMVKSIDLRGSAKKSKNKISANSEKGVQSWL